MFEQNTTANFFYFYSKQIKKYIKMRFIGTGTALVAASFKTYLENKNLLNIATLAVEKFFNEKATDVKIIGSSALSPDKQKQQDIQKHGKHQLDRDIDVLIKIKNISAEDAEKWVFSNEAQQLEDQFNLDVQVMPE